MQLDAPKLRYTKSFSLLVVICGYLLSYLPASVAIFVLKPFNWHPLWKLFAANLAGIFSLFAFSRILKNSSFFDPYWSVAPPVFLIYFISLDTSAELNFRQILITIAVLIWAVRLTLNWARNWAGFSVEDFRYIELKKVGGVKSFLIDLSGIHLFPGLMVFAVSLPLYPAVADYKEEITVFDLLSFALALGGAAFETVADEQLHAFKRRIKEPSEFMRSGLWAFSRHPNYFGEWLFWVGIFLMGLAANYSYYWTGLGVLLLLAMFLFVSIPIMERRMMAKRPDYTAYRKKVSAFVPLPSF